ncbi:MAG: hypothetical protein QOH12_2590 [Solirubrobacteraceae bacterium]|nr:hypothetical protein [Solirubrobacteraceae bacterium]
MRRLLLVRHAPTRATRSFAFPTDEPLDEQGRRAAVAFGAALGGGRQEALCSPRLRCRETALAANLSEARVVADLAECDFGSWAGRTLAELSATDPAGVSAWMTDPAAAPHGGESLSVFTARVGRWLDRQLELDGRAIAVTHGGVVKAVVVHALRAPLDTFWRIDVTPLAVTEIHSHDGRWTVSRMNSPC